MAKTEFIRINVNTDSKKDSVQFINRNHILRVYTENDKVLIEMDDYTIITVVEETLYSFMDRFVE
jgi:hypothetical protein